MPINHSKRPICDNCKHPLITCLCTLATPISNRVELLILQDIHEAKHAKNTAGLLHLSLKNSRIYPCNADQAINPVQLERELFKGDKQPVLLYPPIPEANALGLDAPAPFVSPERSQPDQLRLIVLDATWRKSRKLIYLNHHLQRLQRFTLEAPPPSLYLIRKADSKNQLSTLEASCYALQQLEQGQIDYSPLLEAMNKFVSRQCEFRPARPPY